MSHHYESDRKALILRRNAENRLKTGSAPVSGGAPLNKDALSLLYSMASDPKRSSEALGLLQELQVHQVELDLQREELENSEREMRYELALHRALFELTPVVSLVLTREGRIIEANPAATRLLSTRHGEMMGQMLNDFLKPESRASWSELLGKLEAGEKAASCEVLVDAGNDKTVTLELSGHFVPETGVLLFGVVSPS